MGPGCKIPALNFTLNFLDPRLPTRHHTHFPPYAKTKDGWLARVFLHIDYDIYTAAISSY